MGGQDMLKRSVAAWALAMLLSMPAAADDQQDCASKDADRAIRGCTAVIKAGGEAGKRLEVAYTNRGEAYASRKEFDLAIADYTKAIEINPKYARAYDGRGVAYTSKGDYPRAVADVTRAVELAPKKPAPGAPPAAAKPVSPKAAAKPSTTVGKRAPRAVAAKASPPEDTDSGQPKWAAEARKFDAN